MWIMTTKEFLTALATALVGSNMRYVINTDFRVLEIGVKLRTPAGLVTYGFSEEMPFENLVNLNMMLLKHVMKEVDPPKEVVAVLANGPELPKAGAPSQEPPKANT